MALALRDNDRHTYGDYLHWPDEVRYELIGGLAYAMAPAPSVAHHEVLLAIARQAAAALDGSPCRVFVAPVDVRLPMADEADEDVDTVVQPDILAVCDPAKIDERGIRGAPDWIVEVLSPATAGHDQVLKRALYERHRVREYWLVHPADRVLTVHRLDGTAFAMPVVQELLGETQVAALPGVVIHWESVTRHL
ncbi:Uma2 family endonuclease [Accumulibacter sp.]|uniref:Uma2 family endonuclease n=1 Tax=Accumulibacter sp. TaxID=2053492 RepID=UPI0025E45D84|nr:Uma2 family endonuclease [Accumulibacter sp.]MCM8594059.1 Uma2 family endonuclease [Accumulibacter sp.]MCM8627095.1 Uma2 family endonuclease [Accumulibacter sp.]MDS4048203.1 Uma2 family endonuclease [Accumulibacter sp.]